MPSSPEERQPLFPKMEEEMIAYWKKHKIFERSIEEKSERKPYVFYDGPPFATGLPHYGHLLQSTLKDIVPRYWTMRGYRVPRRWGWDCHGLPIENMIEKELNLGSRREIEEYGIDTFNEACRTNVFLYEKEWDRYVERLGRWVDFKGSWKTMDNHYMESVWWAFAELHQKGFVYKSVRVSLYCPRCSTPLSNFEVAMGDSYIEKEEPAIYLKFPVVGKEKTYFVAWTTTPWSVPGITGLAVHKDLMYVAAKISANGGSASDGESGEETLIFAEARQADVLKQFYPLTEDVGFEITGRWKGSELVGKRFEAPYSFIPVEGDANRVISADHVTADVGTGIVTTAPAYGEEDLIAAQANHLPLIFTVDDEGRFVEAVTAFAGMKVHEANPVIVNDLKSKGFLYREESFKHSVPICWRCSTQLLYKAQPAWFINVTKLKPKMLKTANKINWHPAHFKEGRFGKGLESAPDWNISRTRYWGSPIPVWECDACDERTIIGSIAELKKRAKPESWPKEIDLHRPVIDRVIIPCKCGGEQKRIPEVFDCWVESGSMPFASLHYPFENKQVFEKGFPADFIAEAQDQTRGWFYTLHVLAAGLFGKPAFKDVIVTGLVLAEDGKKMSKKLKNYPDPWEILSHQGADALRYYLASTPVVEADSLHFSERDLQNVVRGFINIFWNVKTFFSTYSQEPIRIMKPRSTHVLDRWIFARYMKLLREVTENMDHYELAKAARPLRDFVDDLSTWWLRRSRDRLKSDQEYERMDALKTLREILEETTKMFAPFIPFIADKIYLDIGGLKASVHLEKWPDVQERLMDERLLSDMCWLRQAVSKGHEARVQAKIPVRQALASVKVLVKDGTEVKRLQQQPDLLSLLCDELNVEMVILETKFDLSEPWMVELDTVITPELKRKGAGREFVRQVMQLRKEAGLKPSDRVEVLFKTLDEELREWLSASLEDLKKELRTNRLEELTSVPDQSRASAEVKVGDKTVQLWLV
ncbi:isoleucine--tRNA ligase [Candidatus Uhrbacteria bacterium]|nr:isoleucine--tRNA ligase [Candidatus Uhrbacteria bacterium]